MANLKLLAPMSGWCASLDEAPDEVFAQRLLGDGVLIDPTGDTLFAPCDGEVVLVAPSRHAVTIRAVDGAEILLHVGIDTVGLGGEGFTALVTQGDRVAAGAPLLKFDLDVLARSAKSLASPIIIINGDQFLMTDTCVDRSVSVGDVIGQVRSASDEPEATLQRSVEAGSEATVQLRSIEEESEASGNSAGDDSGECVERVVVGHEHGIHARPAAHIAEFAKHAPVLITIAAKGRTADARSPVALMSLGAGHGDELILSATGTGARNAVRGLRQLVLDMDDSHATQRSDDIADAQGVIKAHAGHHKQVTVCDDDGRNESLRGMHQNESAVEHQNTSTANTAARATAPESSPEEGVLRGVIANAGVATGVAVRIDHPQLDMVEMGSSPEHELEQLVAAKTKVRLAVQDLAAKAGTQGREIMQAHLALLDDPRLTSLAQIAIAQGKSAAFAWHSAISESANVLRELGDSRLAERVDDLLDLDVQVRRALNADSHGSTGRTPLPDNAILVAEDLKPSQLLALETDRLAGLCMAGGGPTSHVAILAASLGLPALVALGKGLLEVVDGAPLILDADRGELLVNPEPDEIATTRLHVDERRRHEYAERAAAQAPCRTRDGARVEVMANLASVTEARIAATHGAEGCGLLRTEFLFFDRAVPPDEDEQVREYAAIAQALPAGQLVIRTLDAGGDKPLPYLEYPTEPNPALGLRGVRMSLRRPDLLRVQLRAVLRAVPAARCRILLPMITDVIEIRDVRRMLQQVAADLDLPNLPSLGIMIETPAAAVLADTLAPEIDFLSIGTNDLSQYALAMDREHPDLAGRIDALHPAVLRFIAMTADAGRKYSLPVAVCGGLASEAAAVPLLIGLGVRELSVVPARIPQIKQLIGSVSVSECEAVARRALQLDTAAAVHDLVATEMNSEMIA